MHTRLVKARRWAWRLVIPAAALAVAGQLSLAGVASATHIGATAGGRATGTIAPARVNSLDCNGWSSKYTAAAPHLRSLCTDPLGFYKGYLSRAIDNGHYVGHDEPSVKFISSQAGSGNTMSYALRLPHDPVKAPTANGSVTDYAELSLAPWFGLPMCDPHSYPLNPCKPDSDSNTGLGKVTDAGSAFMELQFYAPGFTPFINNVSCSTKRWCVALTIDSLSCTFNFKVCNNACFEPVNFSYLQTNGVPAGPPAPQDPSTGTFFGNSHTLKMNPGDVLKVSIADPKGGFLTTVTDLTTHQTGFIQASAKNGFTDTNGVTKSGKLGNCSGNRFTWHAEYNTARKQNQVPWAALEGGVLMQQEIGHAESCSAVANRLGFAAKLSGGTSFVDPKYFENCVGGREGTGSKGEGPCNLKTFVCTGATTQGKSGPVACPKPNFTTPGELCEFSDTGCFPKGPRAAVLNGVAVTESSRVALCLANFFQNGDLDFDGNPYQADWPNGSPNFPQAFRYMGPFSRGHPYPQIQYETDGAASERLCNTVTGKGCTAPPIGAKFYPFWSMNNTQILPGITTPGVCIWNFGNDIMGVTKTDFGKDKQYGKPDIARFGGTLASAVFPNPTLGAGCKPVHR